jgi:hypothetical protein
LTKPKDGLPPSTSLRKTPWPIFAITSASSRPAILTDDRSAPAARMNGLPVTPIAATSSRDRASSSAVLSAARLLGPNVFGRVWSSPLSR